MLRHCAISETSLYHLNRIEITSGRVGGLDLQADLLGTVIYTQTGREDLAASRYQALQRYDPQSVDRTMRSYTVSPEVLERAGRISARVATRVNDVRVAQPISGVRVARILPAISDTLRVAATVDPSVIQSGGQSRIVVTVTNRAGTLASYCPLLSSLLV